MLGFSLRSCLTETIISGYNLQLCLTEVVMPSNKKPPYRFSFLTDSAVDLPAYEHATKKNAKDTFPYKSFRPGNRPAEGLLQGERQGCDNGGGVTVQLEGVCALLAHECREGFVKGGQVVG